MKFLKFCVRILTICLAAAAAAGAAFTALLLLGGPNPNREYVQLPSEDL